MIRSSAFKAAKTLFSQKNYAHLPKYSFATLENIETTIQPNNNVRKSLYVLRLDSLNKFKYHAYASYLESALWLSAAGVTCFLLPYPTYFFGAFPILLAFKSMATASTDHFSHNQLTHKNICAQITLLNDNKLIFTNTNGLQYEADYTTDTITLEQAAWDEIVAEYDKGTLRYNFCKINIQKPNEKIPSYTAFLLFDKQHSAIGNVQVLRQVLSKSVLNLSEVQSVVNVVNQSAYPKVYTTKRVYKYNPPDNKDQFVNHLPRRLLSGSAAGTAAALFYYFGYYYLATFGYWVAVAEISFVSKYFFKGRFQPIKICTEINIFDNERVSLVFNDGKRAIAPIASIETLYMERWNDAVKLYLNKEKPARMISIKCSYQNESGRNDDFDMYLDLHNTEVENLALLEAILNGRPDVVASFEYKPPAEDLTQKVI